MIVMDLTDIEKKCKNIVDLRTKRLKIQEKINKDVLEVMDYMRKQNKTHMKVGKFSVEIGKRIKRNFDFDFLDELQKRGLLPLSAMNKEEYERLFVTLGTNIELKDGRFIYD